MTHYNLTIHTPMGKFSLSSSSSVAIQLKCIRWCIKDWCKEKGITHNTTNWIIKRRVIL